MQKTFFLLGLLLLFASCSHKPAAEYYLLEGGDPKVDYLEFVNDSTVRFISPSLFELSCPYRQEGNLYIVTILGVSQGRLLRIDEDHLQGTPPFFDGVWKRAPKP